MKRSTVVLLVLPALLIGAAGGVAVSLVQRSKLNKIEHAAGGPEDAAEEANSSADDASSAAEDAKTAAEEAKDAAEAGKP